MDNLTVNVANLQLHQTVKLSTSIESLLFSIQLLQLRAMSLHTDSVNVNKPHPY